MTAPRNSGINIGVLTYDYDPPIGGLGILAKTYVTTLQKAHPDCSFHIISPSTNSDERGSFFARFRWKKSGGCPLFSLFISLSFSRLIRKHRLDVLHVHSGSGGVFLLRKPACPVVVTAHHTYRQESVFVFDQSPLKRLWKKLMSIVEKRTYQVADLIICVSADTRLELIDHYGIPPEKIIVIENPVLQTSLSIPLRACPPKSCISRRRRERRGKHCFSRLAGTSPSSRTEKGLGVEVESNTILFIGRLEERKGIMLLLNAFHILSKEFPDLQLRLIGQNLIGSRLQEFLQAKALQDRVIILGHRDDIERFQEMSKATILVVPSKLEGFGLVAAEGMMMGMCVVTSDAPGLRSIITDSETGRTFHSGNINDAVRVLREVLTNANQRQSLAVNAERSAKERFDEEKRSDDLLQAMSSVYQSSKNK